MKIILKENIENVGSVGQVVAVRDGFARNFLVPRGLGVLATPSNIKVIELEKAQEIEKEKERRLEAEELAKKIRSISVTLEAKAGADGKLFGSVKTSDVQALAEKEGITLDKKNIRIANPIRKTGAYEVEVRCYTNIKVPLKLWVVAPKSESEKAESKKESAKPEVEGKTKAVEGKTKAEDKPKKEKSE